MKFLRPREKVGSMHNSAFQKALEFKQFIDDIAHENACEMRGRYKRRYNDKEGSELMSTLSFSEMAYGLKTNRL